MELTRIEIGFEQSKRVLLNFQKKLYVTKLKNCCIYSDIQFDGNELKGFEEELRKKWAQQKDKTVFLVDKQDKLDIYVKESMQMARLKNGNLLLASEVTEQDKPRSIIQGTGRHYVACCNCLKEAV